jgi:cytochrome c oxidase cbb3-type subunit 2
MFSHKALEKNIGWLMVLTFVVVSIGGLVQIVPLFFQKSTTLPVEGLKPYTALELTGRDVLHPRRLLQLPFADGASVPC